MKTRLISLAILVSCYLNHGCRDGSQDSDSVEQNPQNNPQMPSDSGVSGSAPDRESVLDSLVKTAKREFSDMGDMNGDGRHDLVHFTNRGIFVALSSGTQFSKPSLWSNDFAWGDRDRFPRYVGDVNGDGKADIVGFSQRQTLVAMSDGKKLASPTVGSQSFGYQSPSASWPSQDRYPRMVGFVDQDKQLDIVGCRDNGCYVALSQTSKFQEPAQTPWIEDFSTDRDGATSDEGWTNFEMHPRFLGDVDGDGRSDLIGFGDRGVWVSLADDQKFLSKGLYEPRLRFFGLDQGWTSQSTTPRLVGDIDGDGKADILGFAGNGDVYVAYGRTELKSSQLVNSLQLNTLIQSQKLAGKNLQAVPRYLADVDGDGRDELVVVKNADSLLQPEVEVVKIP